MIDLHSLFMLYIICSDYIPLHENILYSNHSSKFSLFYHSSVKDCLYHFLHNVCSKSSHFNGSISEI